MPTSMVDKPHVTPALNFTFPGIYYDPSCSSEDVDHGVLVVGYGADGTETENQKYWIIKNRYKKPKILIFEIEKGILFGISVWMQVLKPLSTLLKSQKSLPHTGGTQTYSLADTNKVLSQVC